MRRLVSITHFPCLVMLLWVVGVTPTSSAEDAPATATIKNDPYCVVQIGSDAVEIVRKSELPALKKKVAEANKQALKAYSEARKAAKRAKEKFSAARPRAKKVKVLSASLKTESEAKKLRDATLAKVNGYVVVLAGLELHVLRKSEVFDLKKDLKQRDDDAVASYKSAQAAAKQSGEKFKRKKPTQTRVKVLASGFRTETDAARKAEALLEKNRKLKPSEGLERVLESDGDRADSREEGEEDQDEEDEETSPGENGE